MVYEENKFQDKVKYIYKKNTSVQLYDFYYIKFKKQTLKK